MRRSSALGTTGDTERPALSRRAGLAVAALFAAGVIVPMSPGTASATTQLDIGCTIVAAPTPDTHTSCAGLDLTGIDLAGFNLEYADFTNTNLTQANLTGADLTDATLSNANLTWARLEGATLLQAAAIGATLNSATLSGSDLTGANLSGADLTWAYLNGASLTGATLTGAILDKADVSVTLLTPATDQSLVAPLGGTAIAQWAAGTPLPGAVPSTCDHTSGASFRIGRTPVNCKVVDATGKAATGSFDVVVTSVPGPPSTVAGSPGDGLALLTWSAGASNGSAVTA